VAALQNEDAIGADGGNVLAIIDQLFDAPAITVAQAEKQFKLTTPTAQANINKLVAAGIFRKQEDDNATASR
jgi:Fic family protein